MAAVRTGIDRVLSAYEPNPCLAVNCNWDVRQANSGPIGPARRREVAGAPGLAGPLAEVASYPGGLDGCADLGEVAVPPELTAAELSIEAFLPADEETSAALRTA